MHRRILSLVTYLSYFVFQFFVSLFFVEYWFILLPLSLETLDQHSFIYRYEKYIYIYIYKKKKQVNHFILILAVQYSVLLLFSAGI